MPAERALQLHRAGQLQAADMAYRSAIAEKPDDLAIRHFHAGLMMQMGRLQEAVDALSYVVARREDASSSRAALALCLRDLGRPDQARPHALRAAQDRPRDAGAALVAGTVLHLLGECGAAVPYLRRAVEIAPAMSEGWYALGVALQQLGEWEAAEQAHRHVARMKPAGWFNVGLCAERRGDLDTAIECFGRAVEAMPGRLAPLVRLAQARALACDFQGEARAVQQIEERAGLGEAFAADDVPEAFALTFLPLSSTVGSALMEHYAGVVRSRAGRATPDGMPAAPGPRAGRRLRVGYLSPDFGEHAVGTLVAPVLLAHDRDRFEVTAYSLRRHAGPTADGLRRGCERFRDCEAIDPERLAGLIGEDRLDVLVDLAGYTHGARPEVLALRPAPLQLGYLGFIHPQAASWLDAVVLDPWMHPFGCEGGFPDPVKRLGTLMLPGLRTASEGPADRARFGLPRDAVLVAAFNNSYKYDARLLDAWLQAADRAPRAVFVLSTPQEARARLRAFWTSRGGRPGQLRFVPRLPPAQHAARLASCDFFADAFRYQGGASGVAAVSAGLPIVALAGVTPLSRMGAGLASFLGLEDTVCADVPAYIDMIVTLVEEEGMRRRLKAALARGVEETDFFNPRRVAAALEHLYEQ